MRFGGPAYKVGRDDIRLDEDILTKPLRWKKPRMIFVNSMSDTFHETVTFDMLYKMFEVMADKRCAHHLFLVLTKRPEEMIQFHEKLWRLPANTDSDLIRNYHGAGNFGENIWLGVSAEDQIRWENRVPSLLRLYPKVRFISVEPMLGKIEPTIQELEQLHWVIIGGESGANARKMELEWVRSLVDDCFKVNVPVFVKQLGTGYTYWTAQDSKGSDMSRWSEDLRIREFPTGTINYY